MRKRIGAKNETFIRLVSIQHCSIYSDDGLILYHSLLLMRRWIRSCCNVNKAPTSFVCPGNKVRLDNFLMIDTLTDGCPIELLVAIYSKLLRVRSQLGVKKLLPSFYTTIKSPRSCIILAIHASAQFPKSFFT